MKALYFFFVLLFTLVSAKLTGQEEQQAAPAEQKLSATSKYDFIPGESLMFFDDFTQDNVGDFPGLWNTDGSGEIVTTNLFSGRWLKLGADASFVPGTKKVFPDNYTVEFDVLPIPGPNGEKTVVLGFFIYSAENPDNLNEGGAIPGVAGIKMNFGDYSHDYSTYSEGNYNMNGSSEINPLVINQKTRMTFWMQKTRVRAYINDVKIFDLAKALAPGLGYNVLRFETGPEAQNLIANFRVAVGAPDMRNKLITEGKLVTYGIYFDSESDKIKPESAGTMKEIATVLKENPTVNIKIIGHTDSDGDNAKNLDLSKRRAISVKNALSTEYGIEALRIETNGKGESEPIAPNSTAEGKAKNRRVELIKL
ncbi:MAG: OmpA family protein [Bacteroidia bacterium]|nr:OmpA family protein [Bacteroidia bacterium]